MTSSARTKNTIQKLDVNSGVAVSFVDGGTVRKTIYTCPAGKVALVKSFKTKMGAFGGGTFLNWEAKLLTLRRTVTPTHLNESVAVEIAGNGIRLIAGETLSYLGDAAGNNEDGSYDVTIQELPV